MTDREYVTKQVNVKLPEDIYRLFSGIADGRKVARSTLARAILTEACKTGWANNCPLDERDGYDKDAYYKRAKAVEKYHEEKGEVVDEDQTTIDDFIVVAAEDVVEDEVEEDVQEDVQEEAPTGHSLKWNPELGKWEVA